MADENNKVDLDFLIKDEQEAIEGYNKEMAKTTNPQLIALFKHIIEEEQEHIKELENAKQGKFEEHPTKFQDNMNKALRVCDSSYRGYEIKIIPTPKGIPATGYGAYKNGKLAVSGNDLHEVEREIDELFKKYTFRAMRETNGIPDYREISVESDSKENARNEAKRMLYKGEKLI